MRRRLSTADKSPVGGPALAATAAAAAAAAAAADTPTIATTQTTQTPLVPFLPLIGLPLLLLILVLRITQALLLTRTFHSPDEYWQSVEVAHRVVFG